jgi:hypothetical protein
MPATENLRSEMEHLHGKKNVLIQAGLVDLSFLYNNNYVSTTNYAIIALQKPDKR